MKVRADAKGLPLTLEVCDDVPEMVTTDPDPPAANPRQPHRQCHQVHRNGQRPSRFADGPSFQ